MNIELIILAVIVLCAIGAACILIPNRKWVNPRRTVKTRNGMRRDQWEQY